MEDGLLQGKEINAIRDALREMHDPMGNRQFTIETDHENSVLDKWEGSDKVTCWKLDIQNNNFETKHLV